MLYESQGIFPEGWALDFRQEARSITHQHATSTRSRTPKTKREADCQECGKTFIVKGKALGKFCSIACSRLSRKSETPDWMECSRCFAKAGIGMTVGARLLRTRKKEIHKFWQKEGIVRIAPACGEWRRHAQRAKSPVCGWWGNAETAALWMSDYKPHYPECNKHPMWVSMNATATMMKRYNTDMDFRIRHNLRCDIRSRVRRNDGRKAAKTESLLGCTVQDFRKRLEESFTKGMSWENYGTAWEIDHIVPASWFDLTKPEHQHRCWHYSNLRPLAKAKNRQRGNRAHPQLLMTHLADFVNH
jgi:5-methylcytosine-specific restriction endonuclease McrA